jgi:hypothetical protein
VGHAARMRAIRCKMRKWNFESDCADCIQLAEGRIHWQVPVNTARKLLVPQQAENFLAV